jgi:uncharacterized protein
MKLAVVGATGNLGNKIMVEALLRGHEVSAIARNATGQLAPLPRLSLRDIDVFDTKALGDALKGHEAIVHAVSPGPTAPDVYNRFIALHKAVIAGIKASGVKRVLAVGGAASLKLADGTVYLDSDQWPEQFNKEAVKGTRELLYLLKDEPELDWVFLSPSVFLEPGKRTGKFRLGKDHILYDATGRSTISREDYAVALIDELERPAHHRERFTVGY